MYRLGPGGSRARRRERERANARRAPVGARPSRAASRGARTSNARAQSPAEFVFARAQDVVWFAHPLSNGAGDDVPESRRVCRGHGGATVPMADRGSPDPRCGARRLRSAVGRRRGDAAPAGRRAAAPAGRRAAAPAGRRAAAPAGRRATSPAGRPRCSPTLLRRLCRSTPRRIPTPLGRPCRTPRCRRTLRCRPSRATCASSRAFSRWGARRTNSGATTMKHSTP
jgi:hypothetical protein